MDNLIRYRLQAAQEKLESAEILLSADKYKDSISRSYYAIFSSVRAVLALDHVDFSKHAGVIMMIFSLLQSRMLNFSWNMQKNFWKR